jgi:hypothetical protein
VQRLPMPIMSYDHWAWNDAAVRNGKGPGPVRSTGQMLMVLAKGRARTDGVYGHGVVSAPMTLRPVPLCLPHNLGGAILTPYERGVPDKRTNKHTKTRRTLDALCSIC